MKAAILVFPGSNCDRDLAVAFRGAGFDVAMVWHKETSLPAGTDVVGVPGGFSYGDYLRCGAIAARSPVAAALKDHAERGGYVLAPCNGFQILCEAGMLPGALLRNAGVKYVCRTVKLRVETGDSAFTARYARDATIRVPVAHHDGNYTADPDAIRRLKGEDRVAFRYVGSPNGAMDDIAGVLSPNRRVLGLMPHPERAVDPLHGGTDGVPLFAGLAAALVAA